MFPGNYTIVCFVSMAAVQQYIHILLINFSQHLSQYLGDVQCGNHICHHGGICKGGRCECKAPWMGEECNTRKTFRTIVQDNYEVLRSHIGLGK